MNHVVICTILLGVLLSITASSGQQDLCSLPPVTGPCRARRRMFYFNQTAGDCQRFNYGGCRGNSNRFRSKADCEQACRVIPVDACNQPKKTGTCRASIPRWYYDSTAGICQLFTYGGCRGNDNNFATEQQCVERCTSQQV